MYKHLTEGRLEFLDVLSENQNLALKNDFLQIKSVGVFFVKNAIILSLNLLLAFLPVNKQKGTESAHYNDDLLENIIIAIVVKERFEFLIMKTKKIKKRSECICQVHGINK